MVLACAVQRAALGDSGRVAVAGLGLDCEVVDCILGDGRCVAVTGLGLVGNVVVSALGDISLVGGAARLKLGSKVAVGALGDVGLIAYGCGFLGLGGAVEVALLHNLGNS